MSRRHQARIPVALAAFLCGAACGLAGEGEAPGKGAPKGKAKPPAQGKAPRALPPLSVAAWVNSAPIDVAKLKGNVVLLHFWGIVNGPSRRLMPRFEALHEKHKGRGLVVIGITEDKRADVEKFAKRHKITYPLAIDKDGASHDACRVEFLPTVWLIGRDGKVAWRGYAEKLADGIVLEALEKKHEAKSAKRKT